jgi:hypothetical protein
MAGARGTTQGMFQRLAREPNTQGTAVTGEPAAEPVQPVRVS